MLPLCYFTPYHFNFSIYIYCTRRRLSKHRASCHMAAGRPRSSNISIIKHCKVQTTQMKGRNHPSKPKRFHQTLILLKKNPMYSKTEGTQQLRTSHYWTMYKNKSNEFSFRLLWACRPQSGKETLILINKGGWYTPVGTTHPLNCLWKLQSRLKSGRYWNYAGGVDGFRSIHDES